MDETSSIRLDKLVALKTKGLTRSQANKLIDAGNVKVNGKLITKPSEKVDPESKLKVDLPKNVPMSSISIPVIFEDDDVVVINKPAGILVHSKGAFNEETTLADWLADRINKKPETNREGIVHRLDRATSGVMILAKNEAAAKWLTKQFSTRKVIKKYIAIVSGHLNEPEAIIDMPIERNPKKPQMFRAGSNGKSAQTKYQTIQESEQYSELELTPTTGRTHQLRVHMSTILHPIVGDELYGNKSADRMYLHAKSLELTLPNGDRKVFTAPVPIEFKEVLG
jgi:23S rRNA pseudouridine1911/1915/1917 synthase